MDSRNNDDIRRVRRSNTGRPVDPNAPVTRRPASTTGTGGTRPIRTNSENSEARTRRPASDNINRTTTNRPRTNVTSNNSERPVRRRSETGERPVSQTRNVSTRSTGHTGQRTSNVNNSSAPNRNRTTYESKDRAVNARTDKKDDRTIGQTKPSRSSYIAKKKKSSTNFLDKFKDLNKKQKDDQPLTKDAWIAKKKRDNKIKNYVIIAGLALIVLLMLVLVVKVISNAVGGNDGIIKKAGKIEINKQLIAVDNNTRSGQKLEKVKKIIVHNTGESGASSKKMWEYYESLGKAGDVSESMHFLIDTDGAITQCIPCNEIAFHALGSNHEALGVQYCYSSDNGVMSDKTKEALVELLATLCKEYKLSSADILLHSEVTGIACPKYYVDNNEEWQQIISEVGAKLKK